MHTCVLANSLRTDKLWAGTMISSENPNEMRHFIRICALFVKTKLYSKVSFGQVYRRIYGRKFGFTATRKRSRKTRFPNVYPSIYLPKWNIEYGYPPSNVLLTFSLQKDSENVLCCAKTSSGCQLHKTACQLHIFTCQPIKSDVM